MLVTDADINIVLITIIKIRSTASDYLFCVQVHVGPTCYEINSPNSYTLTKLFNSICLETKTKAVVLAENSI